MNILESIRKIFSQGNDQGIIQKGLYRDPVLPTDWIAGAETGIRGEEIMPGADWQAFLPELQKQSVRYSDGKGYTFDTLSCATFSRNNLIGCWIHALSDLGMLSQDHSDFIEAMGFMRSGKFDASDRFGAIASGTTRNGNSMKKVWQSARDHGILPDSDLPFGGTDWYSYHDASLITDTMRRRALKFRDYFDIQYDLYFDEEGKRNDRDEAEFMREGLKSAPLHIAVPAKATHAQVLVAIDPTKTDTVIDSYEPFLKVKKANSQPIDYAYRAVVVPKNGVVPRPVREFSKYMTIGQSSEDVRNLQECLDYLGFMTVRPTGYFGPITEHAVTEFQKHCGFAPADQTGTVGPKTRAALNSIFAKKKA